MRKNMLLTLIVLVIVLVAAAGCGKAGKGSGVLSGDSSDMAGWESIPYNTYGIKMQLPKSYRDYSGDSFLCFAGDENEWIIAIGNFSHWIYGQKFENYVSDPLVLEYLIKALDSANKDFVLEIAELTVIGGVDALRIKFSSTSDEKNRINEEYFFKNTRTPDQKLTKIAIAVQDFSDENLEVVEKIKDSISID